MLLASSRCLQSRQLDQQTLVGTDEGGTIDVNGSCVPSSTSTEPQCPKHWWYDPGIQGCAPMPSTVLNNEGPVGSDINDSRYSGRGALATLRKNYRLFLGIENLSLGQPLLLLLVLSSMQLYMHGP